MATSRTPRKSSTRAATKEMGAKCRDRSAKGPVGRQWKRKDIALPPPFAVEPTLQAADPIACPLLSVGS